jgi:hypothetical protein
MGGIAPAAILLLGWRINDKSISDDGYMLVTLIIVCVWDGGERRLATPPLSAKGHLAPQAPAGGVAERVRCSIERAGDSPFRSSNSVLLGERLLHFQLNRNSRNLV